MTFELKNKALEVVYEEAMSQKMRNLIVDMAEEIDCLKARIDQLERKLVKAHFGEMQDDGEVRS